MSQTSVSDGEMDYKVAFHLGDKNLLINPYSHLIPECNHLSLVKNRADVIFDRLLIICYLWLLLLR